MNRKTCETVKASTVEAIPNRTNRVIQPEAGRVEVAFASSTGMTADYRQARHRTSRHRYGLTSMLGGNRLWRHADFLKLWAGQTISVVGSEVTVIALPTIAILQLHATAAEVGLLAAAQQIAFPV